MRVCSIFIASRISSGCPLPTRAPGSTSSATTRPGISARMPPSAAVSSPTWASGSMSSRLMRAVQEYIVARIAHDPWRDRLPSIVSAKSPRGLRASAACARTPPSASSKPSAVARASTADRSAASGRSGLLGLGVEPPAARSPHRRARDRAQRPRCCGQRASAAASTAAAGAAAGGGNSCACSRSISAVSRSAGRKPSCSPAARGS